jgi:hypothetical protein
MMLPSSANIQCPVWPVASWGIGVFQQTKTFSTAAKPPRPDVSDESEERRQKCQIVIDTNEPSSPQGGIFNVAAFLRRGREGLLDQYMPPFGETVHSGVRVCCGGHEDVHRIKSHSARHRDDRSKEARYPKCLLQGCRPGLITIANSF